MTDNLQVPTDSPFKADWTPPIFGTQESNIALEVFQNALNYQEHSDVEVFESIKTKECAYPWPLKRQVRAALKVPQLGAARWATQELLLASTVSLMPNRQKKGDCWRCMFLNHRCGLATQMEFADLALPAF